MALNVLHLAPGETGGSELYARLLVPALLETRTDLALTLFAADEAYDSLRSEPWAGDVEVVHLPLSARRRARRVLGEQTLLPRALRRRSFDLLHNLFTTAPVAPGIPQVTTILDVIYKRFPETHSRALRAGLALLVPLAARRSRRLITLSEAAKAEIARHLDVDPQRIDVTHLGPTAPVDGAAVVGTDVRRQLDLGSRPVVLTVSAKRPHKNLERLIDAMGRLTDPDAMLVVPGYPTAHEGMLRRRADSLAPRRIRFTDWLDDSVLAGLYSTATCLVFPSLAEGFGLPILDAFARGLPVACSNTSALPEVAGNAALYFDPTRTDEIAAAIDRLLADERLRDRLARAGRERVKLFTWAKTAAATVASYERALG